MEAKGPRRLGAEVWYMRRAVRAQEVEVGSQLASQPCPPETAMVPHSWAADNAKGLQKPQAGFQKLPTEHFMVLEWDRERLKLWDPGSGK